MAIIYRDEAGRLLEPQEIDNNFRELEKLPNGKTFPKGQGIGIQIDVDSPDWGWHDLIGHLFTEGASAALFSTYRGGIKARQFIAEGDEAYVNFHIPHDYAMGTAIYIHAHWSHGSGVVTGGTVTWGFEVMYSQGHDRGAFGIPIISAAVGNASPIQYQHLISEVLISAPGGSSSTIDTAQLEPDGVIQCRVFLDSNDIVTSDLSPVAPFVHFVDIHYQSTGLPTKSRTPDFWGA